MDMQTGQVQRSCGTEEMCTNSETELKNRYKAVNCCGEDNCNGSRHLTPASLLLVILPAALVTATRGKPISVSYPSSSHISHNDATETPKFRRQPRHPNLREGNKKAPLPATASHAAGERLGPSAWLRAENNWEMEVTRDYFLAPGSSSFQSLFYGPG
ncbi:hypothetical protein C7M84_011286 [Penaeus vannamei]|uniref:Uncharacterized protein n=1 Tax=Penaeus vannamei TaxID=6689 RepID=A0A3R7Q7E3_PENVA|nr:hypothetical protein C7M84_011286 [Penaeus vannamei]